MLNLPEAIPNVGIEGIEVTQQLIPSSIINKQVSDFVEGIRSEQREQGETSNQSQARNPPAGQVVVPGLDDAKQREEDHLIQAEQFKAAIAEPAGMSPKLPNSVTDDEFFHLLCHMEPSLVSKIENGEYIELEKLLPKERFARGNEGRMEWVYRDGNTYLVPVNKDQKINGIRCWEQAFRVYATIYCGANPHRAKEIW